MVLALFACTVAASCPGDSGGDGAGREYIVKYSDKHIRVEEGFEINGRRDGVWTYYYDDTGHRCAQNTYVNGVLDGMSVRWYESGSVWKEGRFAQDKPIGTWVEWYDGVQHPRSEGRFENGEATGPATFWFASGRVQSSGYYAENKRTDQWTEWYEDGTQRSVGFYLNGKRVGMWRFFTPSGEPDYDATGIYVDDDRVGPGK